MCVCVIFLLSTYLNDKDFSSQSCEHPENATTYTTTPVKKGKSKFPIFYLRKTIKN